MIARASLLNGWVLLQMHSQCRFFSSSPAILRYLEFAVKVSQLFDGKIKAAGDPMADMHFNDLPNCAAGLSLYAG